MEPPSPRIGEGNRTPAEMASDLHRNGYVLVPLPPAKVAQIRQDFENYLDNIPEILPGKMDRNTHKGDIGAGTFGALNFASAFHCDAAIKADQIVMEASWPIFEVLAAKLDYTYLQCVADRLCYRTQAQPKESFHRDVTPCEDDSVFFGSILNLNKSLDQHFTLVPGTHSFERGIEGHAFTPVNIAELGLMEKEKTIVIPPNHVFMFAENAIHRVTGKKPKHPILRKFVGMRLCNTESCWCPENAQRERAQAPLIHKGGKLAPMVPKLWICNWPDKCEEFSSKLDPRMVTEHTYKSGKQAGRTFKTPYTEPRSLTQLGKRYRDAPPGRFVPKRIRLAGSSQHDPIVIE